VYGGAAILTAFQALQRCHACGAVGHGDPRELVFLDTETTGLAGGTGTHVFLVGVGRFSQGVFVVRQFFMRHPGDERALLSAVARELREVETLVTYNGRAFDMPLLETRFRMHGRALEPPAAHRDLLASSRAIWKHRLTSCSLGSIERAILGVEREVDAPGWEIPQLYFDYLRSRRVEALEPVFEHNRADIVSLARLTGLLSAWEAGVDAPEHAIDQLALALHLLRRNPPEATLDAVRARWTSFAAPAELRLKALQALSTALKRQRRHAEAAQAWRRGLLDPSRAIRLYAAEELAKHLEHRERDHAAALAIARQAAEGALLSRDERATRAFGLRTARLERKLFGAAAPERGRTNRHAEGLGDTPA
jgi:hypothetical protein